jgi:hypothetical protein
VMKPSLKTKRAPLPPTRGKEPLSRRLRLLSTTITTPRAFRCTIGRSQTSCVPPAIAQKWKPGSIDNSEAGRTLPQKCPKIERSLQSSQSILRSLSPTVSNEFRYQTLSSPMNTCTSCLNTSPSRSLNGNRRRTSTPPASSYMVALVDCDKGGPMRKELARGPYGCRY